MNKPVVPSPLNTLARLNTCATLAAAVLHGTGIKWPDCMGTPSPKLPPWMGD